MRLGIRKGTITGKLVSRLSAIGTKSEGPDYFLLPIGEFARWKEIHVGKKVMRWMKDPILHDLVGKIISINGEIIETKDTITIDYDEAVYDGKVIPALPQDDEEVMSPEEREVMMRKYLRSIMK